MAPGDEGAGVTLVDRVRGSRIPGRPQGVPLVAAVFRGRWDLVQVLRVSRTEHKPLEGTSLADLAARAGKHPVDAWLDLVTADGLDVEFLAGLLNTDDNVVGDLIVHPLTLITLSDAGAHLSLMCDAGYSSTLLGKWVRQRGRG